MSKPPTDPKAANPSQHPGEAGGINGQEVPRKSHPLRWFFIVLVLVGLGYWWQHEHRAPEGSGQGQRSGESTNQGGSARRGMGGPGGGRGMGSMEIPVVAATVATKDVPIYLEGLGTVQALNTVTIRARVDGQLTEIAFTEGQTVKAGDVLARIDPAPFEAQLGQATAKLNQDQAQLANAKADLARNAEMISRKVIAQQQFDTQKSLVAQLDALVKADEAAVRNAKVQLGYTTLLSPIDGRVGIRLLDKGNIVHASDQNGLVVITQIQPIAVVFTLPEQNLPAIRREMAKGELTVFATDRDNGPPLAKGVVTVYDNQIDPTTGTIKIKATFPNEDLALWPGQFVNARLLLTTRKNGVVVPASVIQRGPNGSFAFVINKDMTVEIRPVNVGPIEEGQALVEEGLKPGEQVVVEGQYRLQPHSKVKITTTPRGGETAAKP